MENNTEQNSKIQKIVDSSEPIHLSFSGDLEQISDKKTRLTYLKGENLFKQGAFAPYIIYIFEGMVKVYLQTSHDKQINIRIAGPGEFLALSAVFGESTYSYSAIALKDSLVCMIDKNGLKQLLDINPEFALRIVGKNFQTEKHLLEIVKNLSYKQMRGKLASALLYLASPEFLKERIFELLTRQEIADFASISTESAIKFLKEFEKEGILKLSGKCIEITDLEKLEDLSKRG